MIMYAITGFTIGAILAHARTLPRGRTTTVKIEPWDGAKAYLADVYQDYDDLFANAPACVPAISLKPMDKIIILRSAFATRYSLLEHVRDAATTFDDWKLQTKEMLALHTEYLHAQMAACPGNSGAAA